MFRVFREEIKKSTVKYRTPSLGPERLNMDGVYQTFKTLQVNGKPMPIYFHSFIFRWIQLKMTILRKKKVRRKIFPISEAESWNSSVPHWFFTFFCSRKHAFRLFAEAYVTQAGFFFYGMDRSGNLVETIPCHDEINAMVTLLLWNTHRTIQTKGRLDCVDVLWKFWYRYRMSF